MEASPRGSDTLLQVRNMRTVFPLGGGTVLAAVDDVSFTLQRSRTLCIVGESGSGKSMTARSIMRIVGPPGRIADGQILYQAQPDRPPIDIAKLHPRGSAMRAIRGRDIAMIFQEPMTSLSPIHRIGWQIGEPLLAHGLADRKTAHRRAIELLRQVEIPDPEAAIDRYPFEFSGGMRQRAMIAMALACGPKVLIADEPTTALDVTTQAEVLRLIKRLQIENGLAVLFITHDMGVVAQIADDVLVMYQGQVVERGPVETIFHSPEHSYTRRLLDSSKKLGMAASPARPTVAATARTLLQVRDVALTYPAQATLFRKARPSTQAVRDVCFDLYEGENLGIVGESGSGKTTLGNCLIRVLTASAGQVLYRQRDGAEVDLVTLDRPGLRLVHRDIRMVFQDPFASLNPRMTVEQVIGEPLLVNRIMSGTVLSRRVGELLAQVGLPRDAGQRITSTHAFSGGQRQRIVIARTLGRSIRA